MRADSMNYPMNLSAANDMLSHKRMKEFFCLCAYRSKPFLQFIIGSIWVNLQNLTIIKPSQFP